MQKISTIAITGDSILDKISVNKEERFLSLVKILREADISYTHLETLLHDYEGPELYPAAEGAFVYARSPRFVADELKWAGFDMVSTAGNHTLDYSYGGIYSTWQALDKAGLVHAGTGMNLAEAREPAYLDTEKGRVALISMCSSFVRWGRAGEVRRDVKGRPGLNPLRFYYKADSDTIEQIKQLFVMKLGWDSSQIGKMWLFSPAGTANSFLRFEEADEPGVTPVADEDDVEANLRAIKDARRRADYVLVQVHNHEKDPDNGMNTPAKFIPPFARACIDAGADVFIGQGSHVLRGIEVYKNRPIFYDPGEIFKIYSTITRQPSDFYWRPGFDQDVRRWDATTGDVFDAHEKTKSWVPPRVTGAIIAVCSFQGSEGLSSFKFYPVTHITNHPIQAGFPLMADAEDAKKITDHIAELSVPFGTRIEFQDGIGVVKL